MEVFTGNNAEAIDLMHKMLQFDPSKRITVDEALDHPYLKDLHFEEDEPVAPEVQAFDFDFEIYDLDSEDYKELVYEEIMLYHDGLNHEQYEQLKADHPEGVLYKRFGHKRFGHKLNGV